MSRRDSLGIYNSHKSQMHPSRAYGLWCLLLLFSANAFAADWRPPTAQLAGKIAAITGPGVIALEINNRSSISAAEVDVIRQELTTDLSAAGIRVWAPDQAAAVVKVTLSENLQNYVWIAEIQQGTSESSVLMISIPGPDTSAGVQNALPVTLHATPLISASEPILDVALLDGNPRRLLALEAASVEIFESKADRWVQTQSLPISHDSSFPRDLRGRIVLRGDHLFDAYLPGMVCRSSNSFPLKMDCARSDDPWPLQTANSGVAGFFSPARNFFTGALAPGIGKQRAAPQFFTAAAIPREKYVLWILAGVDRQLHLLDGINEQAAPKIRWGSDIAGVHTDCRSSWQVLATSANDEGEDWIQSFEFPDRAPVAVSEKMTVDGKITALWAAPDGKSAIAIRRQTDGSKYEATQLTFTCNQ